MGDTLLALLGGNPAVTIDREFRWPIITDEEINAVSELLRQGLLSDPAYCEPVRQFEEEWARYLGVEHALSRVDGSAALHSACFALGIGPGDEVIVQSYAWISSAACVLAAGAVPVFADINPRTYTLDPEDVRRKITPRTKAVIAVHLWGHPTELDDLCALRDEFGLLIIEDAAHAHGGLYKGRKVGAIGDIGCFSFQASKSLPGGEGGMMVTNSREYYERALLLSQSPMRLDMHLELEKHRRFKDTGFGGFKYRLNPLNAVIALVQMKYFEGRNRIRQKNLDHLTELLSGIRAIDPPYTAPHVTRGGYYGYPILYKPEEVGNLPLDAFVEALNAEGVPLTKERYPMLHLTPIYREQNPLGRGWPWSFSEETRKVKYNPGDLPVTEELYPRLLSIPVFDKAAPCEDLLDQYAEAFRKVTENVEQLESLAARTTAT